jgi:hypothetical protein
VIDEYYMILELTDQ